MVGNKKFTASPVPTLDEGWWASVLAEENRHGDAPLPVRVASKPEVKKEEAAAEKPPADWNQARELYMRDQIVHLVVTGYNRGGLLVDGDGLCGFVPFSHLVDLAGKGDVDRDRALGEYVGRTLQLKVIECVPEDGRVVFSERAAQSQPGQRAVLFQSMQPGQRVKGLVTNVTDFGVFVDLGGVEGLIHISELSWGRVAHPGQVVQLGKEIEVVVLEIAAERCRVALSYKRLNPNPWASVQMDFPIGSVVDATVTSVVPYGAFARLPVGVEGLIHASEIPLVGNQTVKDLLAEGQQVQVRVLHVDADHQRMGLSMRLDA